jgi:Aerobic-type carbon monoxide dehydrogenase, large subunit CoxL/CutL homologs
VEAFVTSKTPVGTLRAPGRFEANFFRERLLDIVATDLGLDPMDFRRKNLIKEAELPFHTGKLVPYDRRPSSTPATITSPSSGRSAKSAGTNKG